jgi:hypothetical protein
LHGNITGSRLVLIRDYFFGCDFAWVIDTDARGNASRGSAFPHGLGRRAARVILARSGRSGSPVSNRHPAALCASTHAAYVAARGLPEWVNIDCGQGSIGDACIDLTHCAPGHVLRRITTAK